MSKDLARRKEDKVTGGHVNYYLVIVVQEDGSEVVAEVEDIIEVLEMSFAAGCVFKAMVRLCKLRMDLGKPGSTKVYEADKGSYYSDRTVAVSRRRLRKMHPAMRIIASFEHFRLRKFLDTPDMAVIKIEDPKRLEPYSFVMRDFIQALEPTRTEAELLKSIMIVSYLRANAVVPLCEELEWAKIAGMASASVKTRETLAEQAIQSRNKANG